MPRSNPSRRRRSRFASACASVASFTPRVTRHPRFGRSLTPHSHWGRVPFRESSLMPIGIDRRGRAGGIQFGTLWRRQIPAHRTQILAQLIRVPRPNDHGGYGWPLKEPINGYLGHSFPSFPGHCVDGVHDAMNVVVGDRRTGINDGLAVKTAGFRQRLSSANLPGETSPTERAPDNRSNLLIQRQRHQLPLVVTPNQ
jgi:hypothetical protein